MNLQPGIKALLEGLIDYAGLFPPASLALPEAAENFRRYATSADRWMLARFILPLDKLAEFAGESAQWNLPHAIQLSILGGGGESMEEFLDKLQGQLQQLRKTPAIQQGTLQADVMELRLPPLGSREELQFLLKSTSERLGNGIRPWFESPWAKPEDYDWIAKALANYNESFAGVRPAGFKMRCGGTSAADFPAVESLAAAIYACASSETPVKFTAGLHHPLRHMNTEIGTRMHGFLNVFIASLLARELNLESAELEQILFSESLSDFCLDEDQSGFRGWRISTERIRRLRKEFCTSYGSCSFDDPREDLRKLGLLPADKTGRK